MTKGCGVLLWCLNTSGACASLLDQCEYRSAYEKAIPKEVIYKNSQYHCPRCKNVSVDDPNFEILFNCCSFCGQAIDWSKYAERH